MREFLTELRANGLVVRIAVIAAIGGFLFGYDTGVISGAVLYIKKDFNAGPVAQELIVSMLLVGAIVGAVLSGYLADRISRRYTKVLSGSIYVIAALGCALSVNSTMLIGFRFLLGVSVGTASFVSPMYISEVSPPRIRGGLTSFNQLAVTSGILISYLVNFFFRDVSDNWRWMLGLAALPGAALAVGMLTVPHTPRWLVENDRADQAKEVLRRLRAGSADDDVDSEFGDILDTVRQTSDVRVRDTLAPRMRPLLLVGIGLAVFQQFVGVNTVIYYAPTILQDTGLTADTAIAQTLGVGITNVVFTIVAILLLDKVGRRPLLLTGTGFLVVALATLAAYFGFDQLRQGAPWVALIALIVYIAGFAVGLGPVFWLLISEIYPQRLRSPAMSLSTAFNWGANFLVAGTFLSLINWISRPGTFLLYTALGLAAIWFFAAKVPETKGKSLEELASELGAGSQQEQSSGAGQR